MTVTALDIDRLRKVWNMAERGTPGEQAAARNRAEAMVRPHGKTLADVPALLSASAAIGNLPPILDPDYGARAQAAWAEYHRATNTPEFRAYVVAYQEWRTGDAGMGFIAWNELTLPQQAVLLEMKDPTTLARQREKGAGYDLIHEDSLSIIKERIGQHSSVVALHRRGMVRQYARTIYRISDRGGRAVKHRASAPPRDPSGMQPP